MFHSDASSMSYLDQAQINKILNEMSHKSYLSTSIDTLNIHLTSGKISLYSSLTILVFSTWVTFLTKTIGISSRWPVVQRLVASLQTYFPQTMICIASDLGRPIDKHVFLNFTSSNGIKGYSLNKTLSIYNMPEDIGLSFSRNYLIKSISTPFFFLMMMILQLKKIFILIYYWN